MTEASGALDLSGFDAAAKRHEEGIVVDIIGPDGETPSGLKIRVAGPDSQRARKAQEDLAASLIAQENIGKPKASETTRRGIEFLARITLGWEPAVKIDGKEMVYSVENAEKLYGRYSFIRDQVDRAAGKRARFMNG